MGIIATTSAFSALSTFFVALRLFTRFQLIKSPGTDDYTIAAALCFGWCTFAFLLQEVHYGLGQPMATLSNEQKKLQLKALWLSIPFYNMSLKLTKASIVYLYLRLFPTAKFVLAARIILGIIVLYGLWTVISAVLNCLPVNSFWDISVQGRCIPKGFLWFFNAAMNILTDLCVLVLPIPVLSRLRLPRRQKIGVIFIFATGGFACVTSMVRLNYLTRATHTTDYTKDNGPIAVWSQIELNMGIICSCLPPLQPLVTRVFPGLLGSVSHSRGHANKYNGYPNLGFNEHDSGPLSSVSASRSKDRAHRMDAITITQELRLESSDHQYAATDATDVEAERPDVLALHPIPVLRAKMQVTYVYIPKLRNACRYLKGEQLPDQERSGDTKARNVGWKAHEANLSDPSHSYLRQLQSQARGPRQGSDHSLPPLSSHSTPSQHTPYSNGSDSTPHDRDDWWYNGTDNLFLNRSGEHHYVGPAAAVTLAKRLHPSSSNLAWDVRPLYDDPSSLNRSVTRALPQMPPHEFAKRLFWVQYAYIGTIFSLIQPEDFEKRLNIVYHHPPDFSNRESCLVYCQVLLVISYGLMYSVNQWSGDDGPPGFKYFKHALRFLPDIHEEGSIFFVEVLCYVAYYMQNLNRRDAAFLYIGLALRMAISLGLHQEVSHPDVSDADRYRRRRAWWLLSVKSGNPITIQDEDIGTMWPIPEAELEKASSSTGLFNSHADTDIEIYRKKPRSGSNLLASVQSITNELSDWLRKVPDRLRIDFTTLDTHINRESVSIFLHFYSCINMTARPLVFYVIQRRLDAETRGSAANDWKEGLSQNIVAVIDSCITAARATTLIMDAAARHNLVATYGYLDGEYIFSAALLLVMVNAVFPHNETNARTMDIALNLLRSMADRGNTYLGSRHSLLLELRASIGSSRLSGEQVDFNAPVTPTSSQQRSPPGNTEDTRVGPSDWLSQQHITFNLDINDDPGLWEEVLGQIDIDMDTDWIENTLRRQD
ncbi:hypothetical protein CNMCM6106_006000 [Aspergillus hiratsukae]|uniref:Xylanolytic transcriptional activator regulatory domain-containing protein n=1 Tax=Aspergillus hiratsukae TaxID=1194566 RepID=A0A8H6PK98_9EURO|nr:hypothetical protein CNMCM6106_006000 [Aspergillus hiratsukae]